MYSGFTTGINATIVHSQSERVTEMAERCVNTSISKPKIKWTPKFYKIESAEFACCKTPDTGSFSWGQIIKAIKELEMVQSSESTEKRHTRATSKTRVRAMVTRDPYNRLYAAFIRDVFMFGELGRHLSRHLGRYPVKMREDFCGYDVTFEDYLKYAAENSHRADLGAVGEHILTLYDLCHPCTMQYDFVLHKESLAADTDYVLDVLSIPNSIRERLLDAIHSNTRGDSIVTLITFYFKQYERFKEDCPNVNDFAHKLWKALKVLGRIRKVAEFPSELDQLGLSLTEEDFVELALNEHKAHSMTKISAESQRTAAISYAYNKVSDDTIASLQKAYALDFDLFGYDITPPHQRSNHR